MKLVATLRKVCAAGVIMAVTAGCSSSSADGPTSPPSPSITASASVIDPSSVSPSSSDLESPTPSVADPSTPAETSTDPAAREAADRAAAELVWSQLWIMADNLWRIPESDRSAAASAVSVEPTLSQMVVRAKSLEDSGLQPFGQSTYHPYWQQSINGQDIAVMGDCTDTSQAGVLETATGQVKKVGIPKRNTRVTLQRGTDGEWRVQSIEYPRDEPCP